MQGGTNNDRTRKTQRIHRKPRRIAHGQGLVSGVIALTLAILCLLGVLAFHFPQYLTTPELRKSYDVNVIRTIMLAAMAIAGGISLVNILFNRARWLATFAFAMVALAAACWAGTRWRWTRTFPTTRPTLVWTGSSWICWAAR